MLTIEEHDSRSVGGEGLSGVFNKHGFKQLLMQFRLGIELKRDVKSGEREKRKDTKKVTATSFSQVKYRSLIYCNRKTAKEKVSRKTKKKEKSSCC